MGLLAIARALAAEALDAVYPPLCWLCRSAIAGDGLDVLAAHQADLRVSLAKKRETLVAVVQRLKAAGFEFVRLDRAASVLGA